MAISDKIRACLAEDPKMPTAEIVRRTGARMNYIATLRWKENNIIQWRRTHLNYYHRTKWQEAYAKQQRRVKNSSKGAA